MRVLYLSLGIVIADQVTKLLVKGFSIPFLNINYEGMYHGQRIELIDDFFRLTFIENPGMAFGLDPGSDFKLWLSLFSLVASIGLIIYLYMVKDQKLSLRIALSFILGGAIGNLIDRMFYGVFYDYAPLFYGKVVDFLDFDFFNFTIFGRYYDRWPIFNLADAAVSIGVLILIFFYRSYHNDNEIVDDTKEVDETGSLKKDIAADNSDETEKLNEEVKETENGKPDKGKEI